MKKGLALLSLLFVTGYSIAQNRIQKAQAFYTSSTPGMQRVDQNGNKIDPEPIINRFIYLECKCNGVPKADTVLYNGVLFNATITPQQERDLKIGIKKDSGSPVSWSTRKGNHLWRIDLGQASGKTISHEMVKKITIKGRLDKTKFSFTIVGETELSAPDMY